MKPQRTGSGVGRWPGRWLGAAAVGLSLVMAMSACGGAPAAKPASAPQAGRASTSRPMTVAQIAAYRGADRQQMLVAGAKKEGHLTYYTVTVNPKFRGGLIKAFEAKYPFIKVKFYRGDSTALVTRIVQEYQAGRYNFDAVEMSVPLPNVLTQHHILQPYYSPSFAAITSDLIGKASGGLAYWATSSIGAAAVGYNTKLVPPADAPKTWDGLMNPFLRGKIAIPSSSTGVNWIGDAIKAKGEKWVLGLKSQKPHLVSGSGRAIGNMVATGQYALTPTYYNDYFNDAKKLGQPVAWVPQIQPLFAITYMWGLPTHSQDPYAAMLFIDFALSKQGQTIYTQQGNSSSLKGASGIANQYKLFTGANTPDYTTAFPRWAKDLKTITSP